MTNYDDSDLMIDEELLRSKISKLVGPKFGVQARIECVSVECRRLREDHQEGLFASWSRRGRRMLF